MQKMRYIGKICVKLGIQCAVRVAENTSQRCTYLIGVQESPDSIFARVTLARLGARYDHLLPPTKNAV